jgi:hypothetical protein
MRLLALSATSAIALALAVTPVSAATPTPVLVRDVRTGTDDLGSLSPPGTPLADLVQKDTQIEPSIAVNPNNPLNAVAAYQEGRIDSGGDATNGFATTFDGGATWIHGELPGLTNYGAGTALDQGGYFDRGSDAVVAFGPGNTVYANSLIFDVMSENGLRSGMAVNVSRNGGRTWSPPVIFQDDDIGGLNDKNWIVVDNSDAPGHHKGRVYVVWDRVAPVVYNYCDHDCEQLKNWLPDLQTLDPLVWPGQGLGAYPVIMKSGALGIAMTSIARAIPTRQQDEPDVNTDNQVFIVAPAAGMTPWPAPLAFLPPVQIASNQSKGETAQRASGGIPATAADPTSSTVYHVWDDGRFKTDGKNDVVMSKSTDEGLTWSSPVRISGGTATDKVNRYNAAVAVGDDGHVHVMWRQRDESGSAPLFTDVIDTFYSESSDGGATWSAPLQVNTQPSRPWFGAFSRAGTFEGDYDQIATAGGYTYIVRDQGEQLFPGELPPLIKSGSGLALSPSRLDNQHQRNWVALVRDQIVG